MFAILMVFATTTAQADTTAVGPQLLPFAQLETMEGTTPYVLKYASGERRVLVGKTFGGIETLVNLLITTEGSVLLERNDPTTLTLVIAN